MGLTSDLRSGLVSALRTGVSGVTVFASMPSSIADGTSALIVLPGEELAVFDQSAAQPSRSVVRWAWQVLAAVPKSAASAQATLDGLVDSVPDAIESDRTLDGSARSVTCIGVGELKTSRIAGGRYLVATFFVEIITQQQPAPSGMN